MMAHSLRARLGAALVVLATSGLTFSPSVHAQSSQNGHAAMQAMQGHDQPGEMQPMMHTAATESAVPTMPGQDAFGAIQEIVQILLADPKTDWSKVNLEALRQHLIDMNDVTLKANETTKTIDGGIRVEVTGTGRTIIAIKRMVPDQAAMIDATHPNGWSAKTQPLSNGVIFTVTAIEPKQVQIIRGLGFIGVMASGNYHQMHHLAMAKGEFMYMH